MEDIQINTTQNVNLNYSLAGLGPRLLSILLDTVFKYVYFLTVFMIAYYSLIKNMYSADYNKNESFNQVMIGLCILLALPGFLYHLLCETFLNGQSFGKKILQLKVIKLDGTQAGFGSYLIRSLFRLIDDGIIGIIAIAASQKTQRLGDIVAGTTVINLNKKITLNQTILSQQKPDYKIVYSQVAMISDEDINTIKEVLDFSIKQQKMEHLKLLADKIKLKYTISDVKQSDLEFLQTLLNDYSHYQFEK